MPLEYYNEKFEHGAITPAALKLAMDRAREKDKSLPDTVEGFLKQSKNAGTGPGERLTFAEYLDSYWKRVVTNEAGKFAAAYFDNDQAIFPFPWKDSSFWDAWMESMQFDRAMDAAGASGFKSAMGALKGMEASHAAGWMLQEMGFESDEMRTLYLQRLVASILGWASRFKYVDWQKMLGYAPERPTTAQDLLCVRLAYDYGLFKTVGKAASLKQWMDSFKHTTASESQISFRMQLVWQNALELSYQNKVAGALDRKPGQSESLWQMAFCIDVRSETIRRHIEAQDPRIQTIGFAGFFGVPLAYKRIEEKEKGLRLPVLLTPAFEVRERAKTKSAQSDAAPQTEIYVMSYFRNLRKAALSSFLFVELFGILSIENILRKTLMSLLKRLKGRSVPVRFDDRRYRPALETISGDGKPEDLVVRVQRAAGVLRHMGLHSKFGRLVFIVGHGSVTTNNAFGSALDCGACGGHAGDINARYLADTLNDPAIRAGLIEHGYRIPDETRFVAAIHETVTDEVFVLDEESVPENYSDDLKTIHGILVRAAKAANAEREGMFANLSYAGSQARSQNWSEVRPEWGLAGNACFIVAPRARTRGVNLGSRSFLHDYNHASDRDYKTLELIMTAPMVVTNWINLQYYGSTVANEIYGAGTKVLHNLVNEMGVFEGNGGDLRVGLPFESVSDGKRFAHEPVRLSVFVEAPRDAIEKIVQTHEVVRQLLDHEWLHFLQIDPSDLKVWRRLPGGEYAAV